jgi:SnoaL-like protein
MSESARSRAFPEPEVEQMVDPDRRLDISGNAFNPGTYSGVDGFRRMFEEIWDVWEQFEFLPLEVVAEGDKVAIRVELRGRGRDGIKAARQFGTLFTDWPCWQCWTLRIEANIVLSVPDPARRRADEPDQHHCGVQSQDEENREGPTFGGRRRVGLARRRGSGARRHLIVESVVLT